MYYVSSYGGLSHLLCIAAQYAVKRIEVRRGDALLELFKYCRSAAAWRLIHRTDCAQESTVILIETDRLQAADVTIALSRSSRCAS
ncbi:MAG: hypothetical protein FJX48_05030 [Alphaproteobacteria bacterium]|nr:hypothetical protein [Alphaproteobacteria bacterium]